METTGWWSCLACGGAAEIDGPLDGTAVPCPDCGEAMVELEQWEVAA